MFERPHAMLTTLCTPETLFAFPRDLLWVIWSGRRRVRFGFLVLGDVLRLTLVVTFIVTLFTAGVAHDLLFILGRTFFILGLVGLVFFR